MAQVIDLEYFRQKLAADQGFRTWLARFQEQFGPETRLQDLSSSTLLYLATPGEENNFVLFDLIMGAEGLGGSVRFRLDDLPPAVKLKILDTALMLLDLLRFEVMRRLGWVTQWPPAANPLIGLVRQLWRQAGSMALALPALSEAHPQYEKYRRLAPRDQGTFLRRLIPQAVEMFREQSAATPQG